MIIKNGITEGDMPVELDLFQNLQKLFRKIHGRSSPIPIIGELEFAVFPNICAPTPLLADGQHKRWASIPEDTEEEEEKLRGGGAASSIFKVCAMSAAHTIKFESCRAF